VRIGPEGYPAFDVAAVEPVSTLILRGDIPPGVDPKTGIWLWDFALVPSDDKITRLVYYEEYQYVEEAITREKQIKGWVRAKKINLIESMNPDWDDFSANWY